MINFSILSVRTLSLVTGVFLSAGSSLYAAVWNGDAGDGSIQSAGNWVGGVAVAQGDFIQAGLETGNGIGIIGFDSGLFNVASFTFLATASQYTFVTGNGGDSLNFQLSGSALVNSSNFHQTFINLPLLVGASTQTWDGGVNGLDIGAVDLGNNRTLTITGTGSSPATRNVFNTGIDGTGTSGIIKQGSGTALFNGNNLYTGATRISQGTLQLGASERISNTSNMNLDGGTFNTGGFDETVGKLSLTNFSTIDFGNSNTSDLVFSLSSDQAWGAFTLNITNFSVGDTLRFGTSNAGLTSAQLLNNIRFNGTTPGEIDSNGFVTAVVPEPSSVLLMGLGLASLVARRRSRRS